MADYNSSYTGAQIDANLAKAATATQPGDLGTAAFTASTAYATAAQGALADSATQPGDDAADLGSGAATDGYVLTADGAGGAAWEAASGGGGTPGGTDTQVQFNDGGAFGGDSGFTFDKTNNTLGLGGGTITASDPIIDMAQTWNNGAVAFTALKANVTDTASAAGSLLMDLQVGGATRFSVTKAGVIGGSGYYLQTSALSSFNGRFAGGSDGALGGANGAAWSVGGALGFTTLNNATGVNDLKLERDAANTLAQRNGVNAQAFNLYNTYTDASNYERGVMKWASNVLRIGTEKLGTGAARALELQTDGVTRLTASETGIVTIDATEFIANVNTVRFISAETTGQDSLTFGSTSTDIDFAFKGSANVNLILTDGGSNALGFFGATPVARPTTAIAAATFAANTSGIADDTATFGGYTVGQVVQAMRNLGFLT